MKNYLLVYLLVTSSIIFAQGMHDAQRSGFTNPMQYEGLYLTPGQLDELNGGTSLYLFSSWEGKFEIYVSDKKGYSISNLNYNLKTNTLESKISKDSVFQFDINKVKFIRQGSKKYKLYKIHTENELFQEIYFSNKVTLLKGFDAVLKKGSINPLTLEYIHKDKYSVDENYYLKLNNTNFIEIDLNKKSFLQLMGNKASSVEKYASDFKLSFKSETDLLKIFQYYDTL